MTRLFLASWTSRIHLIEKVKPPYLLESYHYLHNMKEEKQKEFMDEVNRHCKMFLLDSGAFTFMEQVKKKGKFDIKIFDEYVKDYARFIKKWDIDCYFEMDVDVITGIEKVEEYRRTLERITGKKSIPVFHKSRGKDYWLKMIKEYDYVAIGGIVTGEFKRSDYSFFKWFIQTAHAENCKVHGLGFTNTTLLKEYPFDTVDSTSWVSGARFGNVTIFDDKRNTMKNVKKRENHRVKLSSHEMCTISGKEWVKFAKYIEKYNENRVLSWK